MKELPTEEAMKERKRTPVLGIGLMMCTHTHTHTWASPPYNLGGVTSPSLKKKSRLDPPTFAIKILVHDWSTIPAFFPLLHNQIRSTLSVGGIPIAIEIHSAFSWFPTHTASSPDRSIALALALGFRHRLSHRRDGHEVFSRKRKVSQSCPSFPFSGQSTLMRHSLAVIALGQKDPSANIMVIARRASYLPTTSTRQYHTLFTHY